MLWPNDPKLSDGGGWRGGCAVGERRRQEAAAVTAVAVRCSAWLGVSGRIGFWWLLRPAFGGWSSGSAVATTQAKVVNVVGVNDRRERETTRDVVNGLLAIELE